MNCVIIEDEIKAAEYLECLLDETNGQIKVCRKFDTVSESVRWLKTNKTDLIFLDVNLGDGTGFEIFSHVELDTPVIFTTAYDEYAIKAFELNSLAYLLKPIQAGELKQALEKYHHFYPDKPDYSSLNLSAVSGYQKRFLVASSNQLSFIPAEEIAYFNLVNRHVFLTTRGGKQFLFDNPLEALEQKLDPDRFFRINRQFIINIDAIGKMFFQERGRVKIEVIPEYNEEVIVSTEKAAQFKGWLNK
ncbi:MAG: LytTR family DNA-binding domain-containing protein [Bacteroidota bacterium]|nr:LytTR family DNA-binding domain-containing protein [Bacteroidota bacterium]